MKTSFVYLLVLFHFLAIKVKGQTIKVTYERKPNIEYQLRNVMDPVHKESITNHLISNQKVYELSVSQDRSLFEVVGNIDLYNPGFIDESNTGLILKNISTKEMLISKSLDGKKYLIKDSIPTFNWKIFDEFKTINGIKCQKATTFENDILLTAWFVRKPEYNRIGPEYYGMKNALIMELQRPSFTF